MSGNTSATGGPLLPVSSGPTPLEGKPLSDFIQSWIVQLTGIDPTLVRPEFQAEPPNPPAAGTCWASFRIVSRPSDKFPWIGHNPKFLAPAWQPPLTGADLMQRNESLNVHVIWSDLGAFGLADYYAALMRDGAQVAQNREYLRAAGFNLGLTGDPVLVPEMVKERWLYRVDIEIELRRQIYRAYPVQDILSAPFSILPRAPGPGVITEDFGNAVTGDDGTPITTADTTAALTDGAGNPLTDDAGNPITALP